MAGGKDGFLDELTGDFVLYLQGDSSITSLVGSGANARLFPEAARQGASAPYVVYTQSSGGSDKVLEGVEGCDDVILQVYAFADSQPQSRALAVAIRDRMLPTQAIIGGGTKLHVCNGGIVSSGHDAAQDSSDRKRFWTMLVLRMVISD
jgi:hypothetical protein